MATKCFLLVLVAYVYIIIIIKPYKTVVSDIVILCAVQCVVKIKKAGQAAIQMLKKEMCL